MANNLWSLYPPSWWPTGWWPFSSSPAPEPVEVVRFDSVVETVAGLAAEFCQALPVSAEVSLVVLGEASVARSMVLGTEVVVVGREPVIVMRVAAVESEVL